MAERLRATDRLPSAVADVVAAPGAGRPLAAEVAGPLTGRLGADLRGVRVHDDARARGAVAALGARAFAWGSGVFLGPGERSTDLGVMAHEVAHVLQQAGPAVRLFDGPHGDLETEAHAVSAAVVRGESAVVRGRSGGPRVQGLFESVGRGLRAVGGAISSGVGAVTSIGGAALDAATEFVRSRASTIPGYGLLCVALGRDPITQKPVERTAGTLVRALVGLVPGGGKVLADLEQARVVQRAADWLGVELPKLGLTWTSVRALFAAAWDALGVTDLLSPSRAWEKLKGVFGPPLGRLTDFALSAGRTLLQLVFEGALALGGGAAQQVLAIFRRIGAVFGLVAADPVRFLGNLLTAVKGGFTGFAGNILAHLRSALFGWLLGALGGALRLPSRFDFAGILSIITQVLGMTYSVLRTILVKVIGEPAVAYVEKAFAFLAVVVTDGLGAAWEKIKEFASGLTDTVIGAIRDWVAKSVVGAAITKLVTLFNPVGAIIQSIIAIYNTVMFFIERAQQIGRVVSSVIDSVEAIAKGNVSAASQFVEKTMANTLPVILAFLARLVGLGNVSEHVRTVIKKIQTTVATALERVARWIADRVKGLLGKRGPADPAAGGKLPDLRQRAGQLVAQRVAGKPLTDAALDAVVAGVRDELRPAGLSKLEFTAPDAEGNADLVASASNGVKVGKKTSAKSKTPPTPTKIVVVRATVQLSKTAGEALKADGDPGFFDYVIPRRPFDQRGGIPGITGLQQAHQLTDAPPSQTAKAKLGAFLLKPDPTAKQLTVVSFNSGEPVPETNDSHAERFFGEWYREKQTTMGIVGVEIDINLSPCSRCAKYLRSLARPGVTLGLTYRKPYEGYSLKENILYENTTTVEDLASLRESWAPGTVVGPAPRWTNALKQKEIEVGSRWYHQGGPG